MQNETNPQPNNKLNPVARNNARRYILQAMYQWHMSGTAMADIEKEFLLYHIDQKLDTDYFKEIIHGIARDVSAVDDQITPHLSRSLKEVDPVELSALRMATYELLHRPDVPYRVIINEALELCKKFGSVDGYKFVNGVLDKVAKKHRAAELGMK